MVLVAWPSPTHDTEIIRRYAPKIPTLSANSISFSGSELQRLIGLTKKPIKLFLLRNQDARGRELVPEAVIDANSALFLVRKGNYVGFGSATRIKRICERDPRPQLPWRDCWRTSSAGVLAFPNFPECNAR